ncbi:MULTISPECIES: GNAT family N-acetyltransferase [Niastella]|uniref:GNAT family N-acetyltransferase n=1 Tax=Niastella soli TaxID=2821487 RepID=A0ABS3YQP9_9BACT|nr:GNAT family protein [Niastella soli]MBO9200213.1 GNAT family N-acetyltransferase [Niastella soli]
MKQTLAMKLETERLVIRDFNNSDGEALHVLYMMPETIKYNPSGYPENEEASKKMVAGWSAQPWNVSREKYTAAIVTKADLNFVGVISLDLGDHKYRKGEIWYKLLPKYWGQGLATEATKAMLSFGFEQLQLHRIECGCSIHNVASYKIMEKVGMTREGIKRKVLPLDKEWHDAYLYAILEDEYFSGAFKI